VRSMKPASLRVQATAACRRWWDSSRGNH